MHFDICEFLRFNLRNWIQFRDKIKILKTKIWIFFLSFLAHGISFMHQNNFLILRRTHSFNFIGNERKVSCWVKMTRSDRVPNCINDKFNLWPLRSYLVHWYSLSSFKRWILTEIDQLELLSSSWLWDECRCLYSRDHLNRI